MNNQEAWQDDLRKILEALEETLDISNVEWNEWEKEFIENICEKLLHKNIKVSPKQYEKIMDLWERI